MYHDCHAIECERQIAPSMLMCRVHWRMVPANLQREVWRTYRKGQEIDKKPSEAYMRAQMAAINHVAMLEGHEACDIEARIALLKSRGYFQ